MLKLLSVAIVGLAVVLALPATADAKSPRSPKIKIEDKKDKYKYSYDDGYCKFKYEYKFKKGEEKYQEKGDCGHLARLPNFNPPRGFVWTPRRESARLVDLTNYCNSADLGAALGANAGAAIGDGSRGDLVTILGATLGAILGEQLASSIDDSDRRCIGSALEYVEPGRSLDFTNPNRGYRYNLRPLDRFDRAGRDCRRFEFRFDGRGRQDGIACRSGRGTWELVELR